MIAPLLGAWLGSADATGIGNFERARMGMTRTPWRHAPDVRKSEQPEPISNIEDVRPTASARIVGAREKSKAARD